MSGKNVLCMDDLYLSRHVEINMALIIILDQVSGRGTGQTCVQLAGMYPDEKSTRTD